MLINPFAHMFNCGWPSRVVGKRCKQRNGVKVWGVALINGGFGGGTEVMDDRSYCFVGWIFRWCFFVSFFRRVFTSTFVALEKKEIFEVMIMRIVKNCSTLWKISLRVFFTSLKNISAKLFAHYFQLIYASR